MKVSVYRLARRKPANGPNGVPRGAPVISASMPRFAGAVLDKNPRSSALFERVSPAAPRNSVKLISSHLAPDWKGPRCVDVDAPTTDFGALQFSLDGTGLIGLPLNESMQTFPMSHVIPEVQL